MFYKNFYITVTLNKSLSFEVNEEDNIIEIRRNRNFNKFMVIVSSDKVLKSEQLITSNLLYMGKRYNIYKKTNLKNIKITYYDNINKKVIKENLISIND